MWCVYRLTLAEPRGVETGRDLRAIARSFSDALFDQLGCAPDWVAASAPARKGGVEIWYRIPIASSEPMFRAAWQTQLSRFALLAERVANRN